MGGFTISRSISAFLPAGYCLRSFPRRSNCAFSQCAFFVFTYASCHQTDGRIHRCDFYRDLFGIAFRCNLDWLFLFTDWWTEHSLDLLQKDAHSPNNHDGDQLFAHHQHTVSRTNQLSINMNFAIQLKNIPFATHQFNDAK